MATDQQDHLASVGPESSFYRSGMEYSVDEGPETISFVSPKAPTNGGNEGDGPARATAAADKKGWCYAAPPPRIADTWRAIHPPGSAPPGLFTFVTSRDDEPRIAVKRMQYEKNSDFSYRMTPDGKHACVKPGWRDCLEMTVAECVNLYHLIPELLKPYVDLKKRTAKQV